MQRGPEITGWDMSRGQDLEAEKVGYQAHPLLHRPLSLLYGRISRKILASFPQVVGWGLSRRRTVPGLSGTFPSRVSMLSDELGLRRGRARTSVLG